MADVEGRPGLRRRAALARRRARGPAHADLHVGHHRAAEGRPARPPQPDGGGAVHRGADRVPGRLARHLVAAERPHRRADGAPLPADRLRDDGHVLPEPARGRSATCPAVRPTLVLRGAADLGEADGRDGGAARPGDDAEPQPRVARRRDREGRARAGAASRCPTSSRPPSRRPTRELFAGLRAMLGLDEADAVNVGAAPTPRRGARVLPRHRHPARRAVGHVARPAAPARCNPPGRIKIGTVGPPAPGVELQARRRRRAADALRRRDDGLPQPPDKTAEAIDADGWLHTGDIGEIDDDGYLGSSTARRRSSSTRPARTCRRRTSRRR